MTQPQYGPPPGWPQQQPQVPQQPWPANYQQQPAQAPGGWPQPGPAPQPQQAPQQPVQVANTSNYTWDGNAGDPTGGGGNSPAAREMVNRTVILVPKRIDEGASYQGQSRPTAYVDLYVIDGGPMPFGSSQDRQNPRPATHTIETPAFFPMAMIGNTQLVKEIRNNLGKGLVVGVIQNGTRAILINPASDEQKARARQVWEAHKSGAWTPPVPTELQTAPAGYGTVNYGGPPPQAQQPAWGAPQQQPWGQPAPAPAQQQWQPAAPPSTPPPPGMPPEQWAAYTEQERQQLSAQFAAYAQGMQQAPPSSPPPAAGPPPQGPAQPTWS